MGGRGSYSGGNTSGQNINTSNEDSLISTRERHQVEVDDTLKVLRDVRDRYGVDINDAQVVDVDARNAGVMAYYDANQNLAFNRSFFNTERLNKAYDDNVKAGFHPSRGDKSGTEAVAAHELGHRLTDAAGEKMGLGRWAIDQASSRILMDAKKSLGVSSIRSIGKAISGYAGKNNAECIAEAYSDVYCNGSKAKRESTAVVNALKKYLK